MPERLLLLFRRGALESKLSLGVPKRTTVLQRCLVHTKAARELLKHARDVNGNQNRSLWEYMQGTVDIMLAMCRDTPALRENFRRREKKKKKTTQNWEHRNIIMQKKSHVNSRLEPAP